jgi:hypothetical protein
MEKKPGTHIYDVVFKKMPLSLGRFGLKGPGQLFIDGAAGIVEMTADEKPFVKKITNKATSYIPLFGIVFRIILDDYLEGMSPIIAFPISQIKDVARYESTMSFRAPVDFGSNEFKRAKFTLSSETAAREVEEALNALIPICKPLAAHPYRPSKPKNNESGLKLFATAMLIPVLFILGAVAFYFAWRTFGYYSIAFVVVATIGFALWRVFRNRSADIVGIAPRDD